MNKPKVIVQALTKSRIAFLAARALRNNLLESGTKERPADKMKAVEEDLIEEEPYDGAPRKRDPPERRGKYYASPRPEEKQASAETGILGKVKHSVQKNDAFATNGGHEAEAAGMKSEFAMRSQPFKYVRRSD